MTVIIFNGPPSSGKDASCEFLKNEKDFTHVEFKEQLFADTIALFRVDRDWFFSNYNSKHKDVKEEKLKNFSRREALIHTSENIIKPLYGNSYYGLKASEKMEHGKNYCISDGGFVEELSHIINKFGDEEVIIVRLYRDGLDYRNDSRKYIKFENILEEIVINHKTDVEKLEDQFFEETVPLSGYVVHNNGSLEDLYSIITEIIRTHNERKNSKEE